MTKIGFVALVATLLLVPLFAETAWPEARRIARAEARQARMETLRETALIRQEARMDARRAATEARAIAAREIRDARRSAAEARRAAREYRQRWF
jgi:hypothetical protein